MNDLINLKDEVPLANGSCRLVFQHPDDSDYLIKVIRPDIIEKRFGSGASSFRFKKNRRSGRYISFLRETQEHFVARAEADQPHPFMQEIMSFVETDMGVGLVVRAIRCPDGLLAPTLKQLIKTHRFDEQAYEDLENFFELMLASRVAFSDMNVSSLVYLREEHRFVMIDGLGITNPIPLKGLSAWVNRRSKLGRFARVRRRIDTYRKEFNHP